MCGVIVGDTARKLYADDIKLYSCHGMSCDLDARHANLILGANKCQLAVNFSKPNLMHIGRNSDLGVHVSTLSCEQN